MRSTRNLWFAAAVPLLLVITVAYGGGWSTITINEFPEYGLVGQPVILTFSIRQHGQTPISGLEPHVRATTPQGLEAKAVGVPTQHQGEYTARLLFPKAGDWTIRIDGGFNPQDFSRAYNAVTLPSLKVIHDSKDVPAPLSMTGRGERLFVTKGCAGCHVEGPAPDLSGKKFTNELRQFLQNPAAFGAEMPNLGLKEEEITALTAYLTAPGKKGRN